MSRFGRRAADLTVRTLQLMTVAAVLLAVLAVVWLRQTPAPTPAAGEPPPVALPEAPRFAAAPPPNVDTRPPPEKPELKGPTRFVRRLEAGELLRDLAVPRDGDVWRVAQRLRDLLPALLHADNYHSGPRGTREELADAIEHLTHPPRDLRHVSLFERDAKDPLGQEKLVRVWTLGWGYVKAELRHAEETLRHVAGAAQVELPGGVDVMVTPGMGQDVFPRQTPCLRAAGAYFGRDRYCAVRWGLSPVFREVVLKHELIHAYCDQFAVEFTSSRFVSEGLAEYLRLCRPGDHGFHVPPDRLRGNLARLYRMLRESRFPLPQLQPHLLVELSPRDFYALGSLGYLLAQATMAHIGGSVIERAFLQRSDDAIVDAIGALRWREFLDFVVNHAVPGAPVMTVEDVSPDPNEEWDRSPAAVRRALRALGVKKPGAIDPATLVASELLIEAAQIAAVLRALLAPAQAPVLFTEVSEAMDDEITLAEIPESLRPFHELRGATPRDFVANLYALLRRQRPAAFEPRLVALTPKPVAYPLGRVARYSIRPFFENLGARTSGGRWILCIGSGSRLSKKERKLLATSTPRPGLAPPEVLLVIDLSDGTGDALPLAKYLARGARPGSRVAYWNPQRR